MSKNDRQSTSSSPGTAPPARPLADSDWDDEKTVPGLDLDDPLNEFDRVTAIPELPSEQYVKSQMEKAADSRAPAAGTAPPPPPLPAPPAIQTLAPEDYFTLDSAPPPSPRRSADSTAPYAAISGHDAPTAAPPPPAVSQRPTRSPGVPPQSFSLTGLELDLDSVGSLKAEPRVAAAGGRLAPRDPVLELSLEEKAASLPSKEVDAGPIGAMKDRYAMGDFSGALVIAEGILEANPDDLEAPRYAQSCRDVLTQMYSARIGSLDQRVAVAVPSDQIRWLTLDHRAGFLLSLIDGGITVDQILDISGMTRLDALRIMYQLLDQRVISLGS